MYIGVVTLCVDDLDRAIDFYTSKLGWEKTMDVAMGDDDRWVTVAPKGERTAFTLSSNGPGWSADRVGGFSGVVVEVDDVFKTHAELSQRGVAFDDTPRNEPWGGWATFIDSEGNIHGLHSPVAASISKN